MKKAIYSLAVFLMLIGCGHAFAQEDKSQTKSMTVVGLQNGRVVAVSQNGKFNVQQNIDRTITRLQATGKSRVTLVYDTVNYINVNCDSKEWKYSNDFIIVKGTTLLIDDPDGIAVYEVHLRRDDLQFVNRTRQAEIVYWNPDDGDYQLHADTVIVNSFTTIPLETTDNMALHQSIEDARRQLNEAKEQMRKAKEEYKEHIKDLKRKQAEIVEVVSEEYTVPDSSDTAFWSSWNNQYTFDGSEETEVDEDISEELDEEWGYYFEDRFSPAFLWAFTNWGDQWYNGLSKLDGAYNLKTSFSSWQLEAQYAVIMTRHFNFSLGVGYESDIYKFSDPLVDIDANGNISNAIDALPNQNYSDFIAANQRFDGTNLNDWSSRLVARYISLPMTIGFRTGNFDMGITALPALAINTRHCGLKHSLYTRNIEHQSVTDISNSLAPYKIDLRIDMRFQHIGLFLQVATSPLFQSSNQDLYPIKFGFIIK